MVKKTDMDGIKSVAHTFLMLEPQKTEYAPMIIKHPFTDSGIVPALKDDSNPVGVANIMEDEKALAAWREQMRKQIDRIDSPHSLILMLTKSYFLPFIKYAKQYLSKEDFSKFLSDAWTLCEAPNGDPNFTQRQLLGLFKAASPEHLMTEDEYSAFQELDDTLSRGFFYKNAIVRAEIDQAVRQQAGKVNPRKHILDKAMDDRIGLLQEQLAIMKRENETLKAENLKLKKALEKKSRNILSSL